MYVIHNGATEPILKALFNTSLMEACPRKNEIQLATDDHQLHGAAFFD